MMFWLALALLAGLAIALLVWPPAQPGGDDTDDARVHDHVRRLHEFDLALAAGEIDSDSAGAARAELERAVLAAVPKDAASGDPPRGGRALWWVAGLAVPVIGLGVYLQLGSPALATFAARHPDRSWQEPTTTLEFFVTQVQDRVAAAPHDAAAWQMLARTTLELGRFDEAKRAAERALELRADDPSALLVMIDVLATSGGDKTRARELLARLLKIAPDQPTALALHGMFLHEDGDPAAARRAWQSALAQVGDDSALRAHLEALVGERTPAPASAGAALKVEIALADALAGRVAKADTLFVAVRRADTNAPPLAVARYTVGDLPLAVTLDATHAMSAQHRLETGQNVYVVARVARAGAAPAQAGDLEGRSANATIAPGAMVRVTIDRVLP
jgi:cytochrome c-type biogenesis protein CcmH